MVEDVVERIGFMRIEPDRALLHGPGADVLAAVLPKDCHVVQEPCPDLDSVLTPDAFDLIVSLAQLDTVNDLPGLLLRMRLSLSHGGILMAVIPGAGSLPKLRRAMIAADGDRAFPRIHPQIDNRAATMLLERAGFARQVVDSFGLDVRYLSFTRLVQDLRDQALGSALANPAPALGKTAHARARAAFDALADEDGRVSEHFALLALTGWNS
ncbi:methyltransferase domain-containing protein [Qipengyuania sp. MTN3-11]